MTVDTGWRARAIWLRRVVGTLLLALLLGFLAQFMLLLMVATSAVDIGPAAQVLQLLRNVAISIAPILLMLWLVRRDRRLSRRRWGDWASQISWRTALAKGMLWGIPLAAASHLTAWAVARLLGTELPENPLAGVGVDSPAGLLVFAPYLVLFAPFAEEYVSRALLLERWSRLMPPMLAVAASALVFAAIHLPGTIAELLALLVPGIGLGVLWLRTRSLPAVATAHLINNAIAVAILYYNLAS